MRNVTNIEEQLRLDEGERLQPYHDHLGYLTIGIGRLLDPRRGGGITREESSFLFQNDLKRKTAELKAKLPWFDRLDEARQGVLVNMAFQMGVEGLLKFRKTLQYIEAGRYAEAAAEMLDSDWARNQTPKRAKRLSKQMETGVWQ